MEIDYKERINFLINIFEKEIQTLDRNRKILLHTKNEGGYLDGVRDTKINFYQNTIKEKRIYLEILKNEEVEEFLLTPLIIEEEIPESEMICY